MAINTVVRVVFTVWALVQIGIILANVILGVKGGDSLSYLSLLDLPFPFIGLWAIWKFKEEEREPSDHRCLKMHMLMLMYLLWCLFWVIIGIILVLGRAHVYTVPQTDTAQAFFGDLSQPPVQSIIITNSVQIGIQFVGFLLGCYCHHHMKEHKKAEVGAGFI